MKWKVNAAKKIVQVLTQKNEVAQKAQTQCEVPCFLRKYIIIHLLGVYIDHVNFGNFVLYSCFVCMHISLYCIECAAECNDITSGECQQCQRFVNLFTLPVSWLVGFG